MMMTKQSVVFTLFVAAIICLLALVVVSDPKEMYRELTHHPEYDWSFVTNDQGYFSSSGGPNTDFSQRIRDLIEEGWEVTDVRLDSCLNVSVELRREKH